MVMSSTSSNGFVDPSYEIEIVDDVRDAIRRARAEERVILAEEGHSPVAMIPLIDLQLLLRLEEAELDRIDVEELQRLRKGDEYLDRVDWDTVKTLSRA
jgi:hypothetical protein